MNHEEFCEQYGSRPVEVIELGYSDIDQSLFNDFILSISRCGRVGRKFAIKPKK
jgi:hypothetical protein